MGYGPATLELHSSEEGGSQRSHLPVTRSFAGHDTSSASHNDNRKQVAAGEGRQGREAAEDKSRYSYTSACQLGQYSDACVGMHHVYVL